MRESQIVSDDITEDDDGRVSHKRLAAALGMPVDHELLRLIERNGQEFERYGVILSSAVKSSPKGGRPGRVLWLNEGQAILAAVRSDAPRAPDVRHQVITAFMEYRRGKLDKPVHVREHDRRTSTKVDDAVRLKTNIDRLESVVATIDADRIQPTQPNFCAMVIDGEHVFVDINDYKVHPGDRAVVVDHAGAISINNVDPEYVGFKPMGPRSALGPRYPTSHGGIARNTVMIVGKVLSGSVRDDRQRVVDKVTDLLRSQITQLLESVPWSDRQIASELRCNPKLVREVRRVQSRKPSDAPSSRLIEHEPRPVAPYKDRVISLIRQGYGNVAIARMLGCCEETVRRHRVRLPL